MTQFLFLILLVLAATILAVLFGIRSRLEKVERVARGYDSSFKTLASRLADLERQLKHDTPPREAETPDQPPVEEPGPETALTETLNKTRMVAPPPPLPKETYTSPEDELLAGEEKSPRDRTDTVGTGIQLAVKRRTGPSLLDVVLEKVKKLGPADPNMGWEMSLYTYWFPRTGAVALSIAVRALFNSTT